MPAGAEMAARPRGCGAAGEKQRLGGEMAEGARRLGHAQLFAKRGERKDPPVPGLYIPLF